VLITHEPEIAAYGTRIVSMRDGKLVRDQPNAPREDFDASRSAWSAQEAVAAHAD
jgi:ABC-type lipoprotein export system ATPase subunit